MWYSSTSAVVVQQAYLSQHIIIYVHMYFVPIWTADALACFSSNFNFWIDLSDHAVGQSSRGSLYMYVRGSLQQFLFVSSYIWFRRTKSWKYSSIYIPSTTKAVSYSSTTTSTCTCSSTVVYIPTSLCIFYVIYQVCIVPDQVHDTVLVHLL